MTNSQVLDTLKENLQSGILTDLIKAEEAISVFNSIAKNASKINALETYIKSSLGYYQHICFNDLILSVNRIYDKCTPRNQTRCLDSVITILKKHHLDFPAVIETYQTIEHLRHFRIPEFIINLIDDPDPSKFNYKLAIYFENRLLNYRDNLNEIKIKRDKNLAHNEITSVLAIKLNDIEQLLDFGWKFTIILGWAYLSTSYGIKDDILLKREAQSRGFYVNKLIQDILLKNSA